MSNKFALTICIGFLAFNLPLFAQNAALQEAEKLLATEQVDSAIYYFEMALSQLPGDELLKSKLANIYRMTNHPDKAIELFESLSKSPDAGISTNYWYAYVLRMAGNYEKSRKILMQLKSHPDVVGDPGIVSNIEQAINSCDFALQYKDKVPVYNVMNEELANSAMADFAPVFYGNSIYYASKRIVNTSSGYSDPNNDFIYVAQRKNNRTLDNVKTLHDPQSFDFMTFQSNFAPFSISKDGKTVFACLNSLGSGVRHPYNGDLKNGSAFEMGSFKINSFADLKGNSTPFQHFANKSGFPHLSPDGKTLYFAAKDLPNISYGGYDIYVCYFENGNWSTPTNLGPNINTAGDEVSPFVDAEGILYFASEGHLGFGGFDIFRAEQVNGTWKDIRNLGVGVNSPQDEMYFIYDAVNEMGYFSSNKKGGKGDYDIYSAKKMGDKSMMPKVLETETEHIVVKEKTAPVNPDKGGKEPLIDNIDIAKGGNTAKTEKIAKEKTVVENKIPCAENKYIGVLTDAVTKRRLADATVYITNLKTKETKKTNTSKYGEYGLELNAETAYEIRASRQGYENIIFEIHTGDGEKRTLLGEYAMNPSATNLSEETLGDRGFASRGVSNTAKVDFIRSSETDVALPSKGYQVQIGVFKDLTPELQKEFSAYANILTDPYKGGEASIYRLGVFADEAHAKEILAKVQAKKGFEKAYIKTLDIESRTSADRMNNEMTMVYPKSAAKKDSKTANVPKTVDPELNIEIDNKDKGTARGSFPPTNDEVIVKETPRKSYADNPSPGDFTARTVAGKPLEFKVQIGAYKDPDKADFPDLGSIGSLEKSYNKSNGLTYFYIAGFTTLDDARSAKDKATQKGVASAFIVPFKNGTKVSMSEAVK